MSDDEILTLSARYRQELTGKCHPSIEWAFTVGFTVGSAVVNKIETSRKGARNKLADKTKIETK